RGDVQEGTVNLATETAQASYRNGLTTEDMEEAVGKADYEILVVETDSGQTKAEAKQEREQSQLDTAWNKMWRTSPLTIPIMAWMIPEMIWGYTFLGDIPFSIGMLVLSAVVIFIPGWETIKSSWKSAKNLTPNMDVLIAMGALAA